LKKNSISFLFRNSQTYFKSQKNPEESRQNVLKISEDFY